MAVTYDPVTNRIIINGYSSGTPATFQDIYDADKAGTFELLDGAIDADPDTFSLDDAVRSTDLLALQLDITCTARVGATCDIVGEDAWGNALTENGIDISSGSATTTKYFSSVDAAGITVDGMTNGDDFDIAQGQWGRCWKQGLYQFYLDACIRIGTRFDSTAYFADTNKQISFSTSASHAEGFFQGTASDDTEFRLGVLNDAAEKRASRGCSIISERSTLDHYLINYFTNIGIYACHFAAPEIVDPDSAIISMGDDFGSSPVRFYHFLVINGIRIVDVNEDIFDGYIADSLLGLGAGGADFNDLKIDDTVFGIVNFAGFGQEVTNTIVKGSSTANLRGSNATVDANLIDCEMDWTTDWFGSSSAVFNRKYTFNLKVVDGAGTGIQSATVTMVDKDDSQIFSVSTDGSGDIAEQTILYGYYDQANGDTIQPAGSYSPHTVTISKAGYASRTIIYTIDRPHMGVEKLGGAAPHGAEYRRRRVPGPVSVMEEM